MGDIKSVVNQSGAYQATTQQLAEIVKVLRQHHERCCANDAELAQALHYYINPDCTLRPIMKADDEKNRQDLQRDVIQPFIDARSQYQAPLLLLQGDSGSGKSLFTHWLERELWRAYNSDSSRPIPIRIELKPHNERDALPKAALVTRHLAYLGISDEGIRLLRAQPTVIIFDGLDEYVGELDNFNECKEEHYNPYQKNNLNDWKARVLVTCRTQYLANKSYRDWFVYKPGAPLQECCIAPFSNTQKENYLRRYSQDHTSPPEWEDRGYFEQLQALTSLYQLVDNPLLLHMVTKVLARLIPHSAEEKFVTRADIYEAFIADWFERQAQKLLQRDIATLIWKGSSQLSAAAFAAFCEELALQMFFATLAEAQLSVLYQSKPTRINKYPKANSQARPGIETDGWAIFFNNTDPNVVQIRSGCPLRYAEGNYSFYHRSFLEYFIALALYKDVGFDQRDENYFQDALTALSQTEWNKKHVTHEPAVVVFLVEMMQSKSDIASKLFKMVRASCNNEGVAVAASNAISVMSAARIPFIDDYSDLSYLHIPKADLRYALLDHANLRGANLRGAILNQAFLRYADLSGADLQDVTFGERPYIKCDGKIKTIVFSPDRKTFAVSRENTIEICTLEGKIIKTLTGYTHAIANIAFDSVGEMLASGSDDNTIKLWQLRECREPATLVGHTNWVTCVAFQPKGNMLASASADNTIRLWSVAGRCQIHVFNDHTAAVYSVVFDPSGEILASTGADGTIRLWSVKEHNKSILHVLPTGHVPTLAFHPSGDILASGTLDNIHLWSVAEAEPRELASLDVKDTNCLAFTLKGDVLASTGSATSIQLWSVTDYRQLAVLAGHSSHVADIAFDARGEVLLSGAVDGTIRSWSMSEYCVLAALAGHISPVHSVAFDPKGEVLASGGADGTRLWSLAKRCELGKPIKEFNDYLVESITFDPKGNMLAMGVVNRTKLWSLTEHRWLASLMGQSKEAVSFASSSRKKKLPEYGWGGWGLCSLMQPTNKPTTIAPARPRNERLDPAVRIAARLLHREDSDSIDRIAALVESMTATVKVSFHPKGNILASTGRDGIIQLWSVPGCELVAVAEHAGVITLAFSSKRNLLASGSHDGTIRLWSMLKRRCLEMHFTSHSDGVTSLAFDPTGKVLASGSKDKTIRLWSVLSRGKPKVLVGHTDWVTSVAFHPGGNVLASGSNDETIRLWSVVTHQCMHTLNGHYGIISSVSFSCHGWLASGGYDNAIFLWAPQGEGLHLPWQLVWRCTKTPALSAENACLQGALLSEANRRLLIQHGADVDSAPTPSQHLAAEAIPTASQPTVSASLAVYPSAASASVPADSPVRLFGSPPRSSDRRDEAKRSTAEFTR